MEGNLFLPQSDEIAMNCVKKALQEPLGGLSKVDFMKAYCSMVFLYPGFHPDSMDDWDGPREILGLGREALRRAKRGEIDDSEFYPYEIVVSRLTAA